MFREGEITLNWKYSEFSRKFVCHVLTGLGVASRLSAEGNESGHRADSFRSVSPATGTAPGTKVLHK